MSEREVSIRITAKNLSDPAFKSARESLASLGAEAGKTGTRIGSLGDMFKNVGATGMTAFGSLASGFAIGAAAKKVIDFSGHVSDLSAKLGMSTGWVQKFDLAFKPAGVSIDTVSQASLKLSKGLVGGDSSVAGALSKMGLSVSSLKTMAPEQQFLAVADAVGKIQNPTERAYAAMTVFGKGGAELLPGLTGKLTETTEEFERLGMVISDDTIRAADDFGDQMGMIGTQMTAVIANAIGPMMPALSLLATGLGKVASIAGGLVGTAIKGLTMSMMGLWSGIAEGLAWLSDLAQKVPLVGKHFGGLADASVWLRESSSKTFASMEKLALGTTSAGAAATGAAQSMIGFGESAEVAAKASTAAAKEAAQLAAYTADLQQKIQKRQLDELDRAGLQWMENAKNRYDAEQKVTAALAATQVQISKYAAELNALDTAPATFSIQGVIGQVRTLDEELGKPPKVGFITNLNTGFGQLKTSLSKSFADLPGVILAAFQGGGDVGKAVGGSIMGNLFASTGPLGSLFQKGGDALGKMAGGGIGKMLGSSLGSMIPGLGTMLGGMAGELIGPLINKVSGAIKNIFGGPDKKELEGRSVVADFKAELEATLTVTQKLEAGNDKWARSFIPLRDALLKVGVSHDEVASISDRLWKAEKQGGDAVKRVLAEISTKLTSGVLPAHQQANAIAVLGWQGTIDLIKEAKDQTVDVASALTGTFAPAVQDANARVLGLGEVFTYTTTTAKNGLSRVADATQYATTGLIDATGAADLLGQQMGVTAVSCVGDFAGITKAIDGMKQKIATPITIPVTVTYRDWMPDLSGLTAGQRRVHEDKAASESQQAAAMTDDDARAAIDRFLAGNPNDRHRIVSALGIAADRVSALGYHTGGRIPRAHTGMYFGEGLAGDEVPIIAQTGEYMLSRRHVGDLGGAAGVERLLSAARGQGRGDAMPIVVNVELYVQRDKHGQLRLTERDKAQVQDWLSGGSLQVPARAISGGAR